MKTTDFLQINFNTHLRQFETNTMKLNWRKTRVETPPKDGNENIAWITESMVIQTGFFDGKFRTYGTIGQEVYSILEVVCWCYEGELVPEWFDAEQELRTVNELNY